MVLRIPVCGAKSSRLRVLLEAGKAVRTAAGTPYSLIIQYPSAYQRFEVTYTGILLTTNIK